MLTRRQKTAFLALASSVCVAGLLAFALGAGATVTARSDGFESGSLSGWDNSNTTSRSTLTVGTTHAFDGLYGAHAAISADSTASNTYARTIWQPNWQLGDD